MGKAPVTIEEAKKPIIPLAGKSPAKSPNSDRYRKPNTEDTPPTEAQVAAPLDPVEIINKSTITLNREIYSRKGFNQTVGVDFEEFSKKEDTFSVTQFFQLYNALFFDIPRIGVESHNAIKRRSSEFIRGFSADNDPKDDTIDNLNNKVLELEQQLLLANQTDPEHPFFRNGSLVAESVDGQRTGKFYYMDKGYKRKVDYTATFYKTLLSVLGYPTADDYPETSITILSQIKTGPNLSEGNFEQGTFIENGELYVGENVNDDTKDARINDLNDQLGQIKSGDFSNAPELEAFVVDSDEAQTITDNIANFIENKLNEIFEREFGSSFIASNGRTVMQNDIQELFNEILNEVVDKSQTAFEQYIFKQ